MRIDNHRGISDEDSAKVLFIAPSQVLIRNPHQETAYLECLTKFPIHSHSIRWARLKGLLSNYSKIDNSGNLLISNLTFADEGDYLCSVNASSSDHLVRLSIVQKPIIERLPQDTVSPASKTVRIECPATGMPPPVVSFFKDGQPLHAAGRISIKHGIVIITQSLSSDTGIYECRAENEAGIANASIKVDILSSENQPHAPTGLTSSNLTSTSVRITWKPSTSPDPNFPIIYYTLHTTPEGSSMQDPLGTQKTTFLVEKLQAFTNYSFLVRAYNKYGASEPSEELFIKTDEDVPILGPHFEMRAVTSTKLLLTWKPLSVSLSRGIVKAYEVHYRRVAQNNYLVSSINNGNDLQFTLEDLMPSTAYQFRMLAATSKGFPVPALDDERFPWQTYTMPSPDQVLTTTSEMISINDKSNVKMETSGLLEDEELESHHEEPPTDLSKSSSLPAWISISLFILFLLIACVIAMVVVAKRKLVPDAISVNTQWN